MTYRFSVKGGPLQIENDSIRIADFGVNLCPDSPIPSAENRRGFCAPDPGE